MSCSPCFPVPAPRFPRRVWRGVLSGCPLSSLADTPFHAVCAFRGLGSVALLVFPACPLCVCALALLGRVHPPPSLPWLVWRVHLARSRCLALLGPFHAVRDPPRVLPQSHAPFGWLGAGGRPCPVSPLPCLGLCAPRGVGLRAWGVPAPGGGVGGGGGRPVCRSLRRCGRVGQWGGELPCLGPSPCLPRAGNKAGVLGVALASEGVAPIPLRFVLACCPRARSVWRPCVLARVRLSIAVPAGAGGWGLEAGPAPVSLPGAVVLFRGGGTVPSASGGGGGGGRRPRGPRAGWGGGGDRGGGSCRGSPPPPSGGGGLWPSAQSPLCRRRIPPRCTRSVGVLGQPRAPGAACRRWASLAGEGGL